MDFGEKTDLVSVLGGAASAIMDHFGFGLDWKELFAIATENFQQFETLFENLGPLLFSSATELFNHIKRNDLHADHCPKVSLCKYADVCENGEGDSVDRRYLLQEFENSFKNQQ